MVHEALLLGLILLFVDLMQLELELELGELRDDALFVELLLPRLTIDLLEDVLDALARAQDGKGQDAKKASKDHGSLPLLALGHGGLYMHHAGAPAYSAVEMEVPTAVPALASAGGTGLDRLFDRDDSHAFARGAVEPALGADARRRAEGTGVIRRLYLHDAASTADAAA
jgi:hypothetical protein